jgi:hypothetical protein
MVRHSGPRGKAGAPHWDRREAGQSFRPLATGARLAEGLCEEVPMRRARVLPLAAVVVVACFEQTDPFHIPEVSGDVSFDLGGIDGSCSRDNGDVAYKLAGDVCTITIAKSIQIPIKMIKDFAVQNGVDVSKVDVSFHGVDADDAALKILAAHIAPAGGAVMSWTGTLTEKQTPLPTVSESNVTFDDLVPAPVTVALPSAVIDDLDDAWANDGNVSLSFKMDVVMALAEVAAQAELGDHTLTVTFELTGNGKTTTHGWP